MFRNEYTLKELCDQLRKNSLEIVTNALLVTKMTKKKSNRVNSVRMTSENRTHSDCSKQLLFIQYRSDVCTRVQCELVNVHTAQCDILQHAMLNAKAVKRDVSTILE